MNKTIGTKFSIGLLITLIIASVGYIFFQYFIFGPSDTSGFVGIKLELQDFNYNPWIIALYVHIISATIALILGPLQFSSRIRSFNQIIHRKIGKVYIISIFVSFIFGLYLSFQALGGIVGIIGFYSLEVVWFITTFIGYIKIRKRDVGGHKIWMMRSYSVTLAFITFRILSTLAIAIEKTPGTLFGLCVILSWVLNLLLVEWIITRLNIQTNNTLKCSQAIS